MHCTLCKSATNPFVQYKGKDYYKCPNCLGILLSANHYLDRDSEKNRYDSHSDDITNVGYRSFVAPIVNSVSQDFLPTHVGLDFGCGKSAIIQNMLSDKGFQVEGYDPFYFPEKELLNNTYDYITCCEVVEHFYDPHTEFALLYKLLKKGGKLYLKTNLFNETMNFEKWWYKNDSTHVFFYTKETMEYIKRTFGFTKLVFQAKHMELHK